ncbi:MAG: T9SS type A sorting domain-containing protein [Paludibacter sp.]
MRIRFILAILLICSATFSQIKILFDDTKAEQASNADWVISNTTNPVQVPTPSQSGITGSTTEDYWDGALSAWGVDCVKKGYYVETLPPGKSITYGSSTNAQDLSKYNAYVVCEPNTKFSSSEKTAIMNFVKNGGGLFMISDHNGSDRNSDGYDSPAIWNDFLTTNSVQANPFGFSFDLVSISQTSSNVTTVSNDSILHGPMGTCTKVMWSAGTTMTINKNVNSTVQGYVFTNGSSTSGTTNVMFATAKYGNGKVAAIGDSSPCDDGTGASGESLYNGYTGDVGQEHRYLLMNATIWLATHKAKVSSAVNTPEESALKLFPNPVIGGKLNIRVDGSQVVSRIQLVDLTGKTLIDSQSQLMSIQSMNVSDLHSGVYLCRINSGNSIETRMISIQN